MNFYRFHVIAGTLYRNFQVTTRILKSSIIFQYSNVYFYHKELEPKNKWRIKVLKFQSTQSTTYLFITSVLNVMMSSFLSDIDTSRISLQSVSHVNDSFIIRLNLIRQDLFNCGKLGPIINNFWPAPGDRGNQHFRLVALIALDIWTTSSITEHVLV